MNAAERLKQRIAELQKQKSAGIKNQDSCTNIAVPQVAPEVTPLEVTRRDAAEVAYNPQQQRAIDLIVSGKSCVITGAAGTGKTTTIRGAILQKIQAGVNTIPPSDHKYLTAGAPSIVCVAFTNKAVQNMKKVLPADLQANCITIHKLLQFQPVWEDVLQPDGTYKSVMRFTHTRHANNPLPHIDVLIIDEATMVSVDMWNLVADAILGSTQVIIIGDIHQLPPVFGKSIFIWAMQLGAETVELTHVYRQALESPIISLATHIREGKQIPPPKLDDWCKSTPKGVVTIKPWKKKLSDVGATKVIQMFLAELIDSGQYDPIEDVILTPFNKSFGTIAMNAAVAGHLASIEKDPIKKEVWEVFSGIHKKYFRIGDKVLFQKSEAYIVNIATNRSYYGKRPRPPSSTMDYSGVESDPEKRMLAAIKTSYGGMDSLEDVDAMLAQFASHTEEDQQVSREASHVITLYIPDTGEETSISSAGEINALELGYAITVHKSQGSEYRRVFFITHSSQSNMLYRELVYTAITRAREELYVICESNLFLKGTTSQRIPGNTLEDKIRNFDRQVQLAKGGEAEKPIRPELLLN